MTDHAYISKYLVYREPLVIVRSHQAVNHNPPSMLDCLRGLHGSQLIEQTFSAMMGFQITQVGVLEGLLKDVSVAYSVCLYIQEVSPALREQGTQGSGRKCPGLLVVPSPTAPHHADKLLFHFMFI